MTGVLYIIPYLSTRTACNNLCTVYKIKESAHFICSRRQHNEFTMILMTTKLLSKQLRRRSLMCLVVRVFMVLCHLPEVERFERGEGCRVSWVRSDVGGPALTSGLVGVLNCQHQCPTLMTLYRQSYWVLCGAASILLCSTQTITGEKGMQESTPLNT